MIRSFAVFFVLVGFASCACASIPDGNVVKGRLEISGFTGAGSVTVDDDNSSDDFITKYDWLSAEIDYGMDDGFGIGVGYWGQTYKDEPYFEEDPAQKLAMALTGIGLIPSGYIDYLADIHLRYQFLDNDKGAWLDASWVVGAGILQGRDLLGDRMQYFIPELGAAFSKRFDRVTLRINAVLGVPGGAEIGIKLIDNLEVTFGNNVFNIKFVF